MDGRLLGGDIADGIGDLARRPVVLPCCEELHAAVCGDLALWGDLCTRGDLL